MDEEEKIGSDYLVNVVVDTDLTIFQNDNLKDTVDYVSLYNIVKEEMGRRARLLEHVAERIVNRVLKDHPSRY
jgi:dihydroneopterin aldolase